MRSFSASSAVLAVVVFVACSDNTSTLGTISATGGGAAGKGGAAGGNPVGGAGGSTGSGSGGAVTGGGSGGTTAMGGPGGGSPVGGAGGSTPVGGSGGAGGSTSVGGSGSGKGGSPAAGNGGAPPTLCDGLFLEGPIRGIDRDLFDTRRELSPALVPHDDGTATLAFHWTSYPGQTIFGVRYLPFEPFAPWPSTDFGPTFGGEPYDLQPPIAAAPGFGGGAKSVAVLAHDPGFSAETGSALFLPSVSSPFSSGTGIVLESLDQATPAFVARGKDTHYVGYTVLGAGADGQPKARISGGRVTNGVYTKDPSFEEQGCATSALFADAIPFGDSALVIQSTSRTCCSCDDGIDGPPTKAVVRLLGGGEPLTFTGTASINFVKVVARSDGAWIVVGRDGSDNGQEGNGIIEIGRVGLDGAIVLPLEAPYLGSFQLAYSPVTAAALGDDLVLATIRGTGKGSDLQQNVYGPGGNIAGGLQTFLPSKHAARAPSLLANATGTRLLTAWSLPSETEPEADRIQMARFARACDLSP